MENNKSHIEKIRNALQLKKSISVEIVSNSMSPLIIPGDNVIVDYFDPGSESLKVFDIVLFSQNSIPICHFIYHIQERPSLTFITRGLNSKNCDMPIDSSQILGIVRSHKISKLSKFKIIAKRLWSHE